MNSKWDWCFFLFCVKDDADTICTVISNTIVRITSIRLIISFKFCLSLWLCDVLIFSIILYNIFFWYWFACNRWFRQDVIWDWSFRLSWCLSAWTFRVLHLYIYFINFYFFTNFLYYCTRRSLGAWKLAFKVFDLNSISIFLLFVITNLSVVYSSTLWLTLW